MKRSEINRLMRESVRFMKTQNFSLPKFAFWSIEDWKSKGQEIKEILNNQLGWDITDYGWGDFRKTGLIHFTIRNGNPQGLKKGEKPYCEKIMIIDEEQSVPMHHHGFKIEDIINRGGGILMIELYNSTEDNKPADTPVIVSMDGVKKTLLPGSIVELSPGDSITFFPHHFHKFWGKKGHGMILIGEISSVNDDYKDNTFYKELKRFTDIEEDVEPLYLLHDDYKNYVQFQ